MPARVIKYLIVLGLIGAAIVYIVVLNSTTVSVFYTSASSVTAPMSVILISVFILGVCFTGIITFFITAKFAIKEWHFKRADKKRLAHEELIRSAREYYSLTQYKDAQTILNRVVEENPNNIQAWVHLADAQYKQGHVSEASQTLDSARRANPANIEILINAADMHEKNSNLTAAYDCLMLVLDERPGNIFTLKTITRVARTLKRFDITKHYLTECIRRVADDQRKELQNELATVELEATEATPNEQERLISGILKEHRDFPPALAKLADIKQRKGEVKEASTLLLKAFEKTANASYLNKLALLWLSQNEPNKAVSAIETAVHRSSNETTKFTAAIFLTHLFLHLEMLDSAKSAIGSLALEQANTDELRLAFRLAQVEILYREGNKDRAFTELANFLLEENLAANILNEQRVQIANSKKIRRIRKDTPLEPPSPQLSTP